MKKIALVAFLVICALGFAASQMQAQPANGWAGVWKLDSSKSRLHNTAPRDVTLHIEVMDGQNVKFTANGAGPDGKPFTESFAGKPDGNQYPLIVNGAEAGKVSYRQESANKFSALGTLPDGSITESLTLSPDGRTITVHVQLRSTQGDYDETEVFIRQ